MSERVRTLVRVRRLLERRALGELAAGRRREQEAAEAMRASRDAYERRPRATAPLSPLELRALELQGLASFAAVEEAGAAGAEATATVETLHAAWSRASVRRKSAERLGERRHAAAVAAAEASRTRALEELVTLRHGGRR